MQHFPVSFARPWEIKVPKLFRYMRTSFVEDFFENGSLMLTSYERCRNHEDSTRKDTKEGTCNFNLVNGNFGAAGVHSVGQNSYMLCCSTSESDYLQDHFECDNYLIINDVFGFIDAVSRHVPGFVSGKLGSCIYKEERMINKTTSQSLQPNTSFLDDSGNLKQGINLSDEFNRMNHELYSRITNELTDNAYFLKNLEYSSELEFRVIWSTTKKADDVLKIKCPEAISFCEYGNPLSRQIAPLRREGDGRISVIAGSTSPSPE